VRRNVEEPDMWKIAGRPRGLLTSSAVDWGVTAAVTLMTPARCSDGGD
jgi:hypothetical protein